MLRHLIIAILGLVVLVGWGDEILHAETLHADSGQDAWLRYAPLESTVRARYETLPESLVVFGDSALSCRRGKK